MAEKKKDMIVGLVFLILGIVGLVLAINFADPIITLKQTISSKFFPEVICGIMIVFAILLIISSYIALKDTADSEIKKEGAEGKPEYKRVVATFIAFTVFVLLMDKIGFLIVAIIYLPIQMFILAPVEKQGKKNIAFYIILGVIASFIIYFMFVYGFKVMLPKGIL